MRTSVLLFLLSSCTYGQSGSNGPTVNEKIFATAKDKGQVEKRLVEASGLTASFQNPGHLWTLNDSGNPAEVFLIDTLAKTKLVCTFPRLKNRDWEDIAIGRGPVDEKKYLYIAEIGDNNAKFDFKYLFRFEEPSLKRGEKQTITSVETLVIKMPDGKRDTETIMIDPTNGDFYIISKREENVRVYFQKYPYPKDTLRPEKVLSLPMSWVTAGSISKDGNEVLIKNYTNIYYWKRNDEKSLKELLAKEPTEIPYDLEQQGEAICFTNDDSGFYTLSETRTGQPLASLRFYCRLK